MKKLRIPKGLIQLACVFLFVAFSILVSQGLKSQYQPPKQNEGGELEIVGEAVLVSPSRYRIQFTTTGVIQAKNEIEVVPQVSGRVLRLAEGFDDGGTFDSGEVLFELEEDDFIFEVRRLEAEVARAETSLEIEKAEVDAAIADWRELNGDRPIPKLVKREPQLREQQVNLEAAKAQLSKAELELSRASYRLPAAGRVLESRVAVGQFLQAGGSFGRVFYFQDLEVVASLDDERLNWLYGSDDPEITVTATYLGNEFKSKARLDRGASSLDTQTRFASVRFQIEEGAEILVPGVFVNLQISGASYEGVAKIPLGAVQQEGHLWLVDDELRLRRHEPDILHRGTDYVAVRNLGEDSKVMTMQLPGAVDGARVRLRTEEEPSTKAGS